MKEERRIENIEIKVKGDQVTFTDNKDFSETYTFESSSYMKNNETGNKLKATIPLPLEYDPN